MAAVAGCVFAKEKNYRNSQRTQTGSNHAHKNSKKKNLQITMSFVELYNGRLFDLLTPKYAQIKLLEDGQNNVPF